MDVYSKMTDEELAIAYIKGDNNAFDLLLSRNQQRLYSYILFVVHDSEMAEDVFQDTFVKVIMRLQSGQYTSCGKFSAWIMRIAHNVIMDYYRDQRIESVVSTVDNEDLSQIDGRHVIVPNVESRYVNEQVYSDVRRMMNLLPPSQREVIFMRFFQEMSFKEIAEATSVCVTPCSTCGAWPSPTASLYSWTDRPAGVQSLDFRLSMVASGSSAPKT